MEWSDYRQALARGWWLILLLGIAGLAIGVLLPSSVVKPLWSTTTSIGAPPGVDGGNSSPLPPGVTTEQIEFFAHRLNNSSARSSRSCSTQFTWSGGRVRPVS